MTEYPVGLLDTMDEVLKREDRETRRAQERARRRSGR
jgi:hypothetical protein